MNKKEPYIGMPIILGDFETSAAGRMQRPMPQAQVENRPAGTENQRAENRQSRQTPQTTGEAQIQENANPQQAAQPLPQPQSMVVGMAYVPRQRWEDPYSDEEGFSKGTIFPDLYFPFKGAQGGKRR